MILALALAAAATRPQPASITNALMRLNGEQQAGFATLMAPDAWLLDPGVQPAQAVLAHRSGPFPPRSWWPARTVTSCDGGLALSTGTYRDPGAPDRGYITIWERQGDREWRWVFDGQITATPARAPSAAVTLTAACARVTPAGPDPTWQASGESGDGTLRWRLSPADEQEKHRLVAEYLTKSGWQVFEDATVG